MGWQMHSSQPEWRWWHPWTVETSSILPTSNFPYVEFHLVMQSRLSHSSAIPICLWLAFSFSAPKVLLWKQSTASDFVKNGLLAFEGIPGYQIHCMGQTGKVGPFLQHCWWWNKLLSSLPSTLLLLQLSYSFSSNCAAVCWRQEHILKSLLKWHVMSWMKLWPLMSNIL